MPGSCGGATAVLCNFHVAGGAARLSAGIQGGFPPMSRWVPTSRETALTTALVN